MTKLRAVICDDEPLAVERLERMLNRVADVEVVGSFTSGEDLLANYTRRADVMLLDIEMPKVDGFDVVEALSQIERSESDEPPLIIFVTAHSEFAVDAFDTGAVDFLTKPVRLSRLQRALERARLAIDSRQARRRFAEVAEQLSALKRLHAEAEDEPHLWVRKRGERIRIDVSTIDWVAAEGECVRFHCGAESYLLRLSISNVATQFSPLGFLRIHRSAVVNAARIEALARTRWGAVQIRLRTGAELRVSKSFESVVRRLTGRDARSPADSRK